MYLYKFKLDQYIKYHDILMYRFKLSQYRTYIMLLYAVLSCWCSIPNEIFCIEISLEQKRTTSMDQNQLIHTVLYRAIYHCIVIVRRQHIVLYDPCIVLSLVRTLQTHNISLHYISYRQHTSHWGRTNFVQ